MTVGPLPVCQPGAVSESAAGRTLRAAVPRSWWAARLASQTAAAMVSPRAAVAQRTMEQPPRLALAGCIAAPPDGD